jgi:hypothetical protein
VASTTPMMIHLEEVRRREEMEEVRRREDDKHRYVDEHWSNSDRIKTEGHNLA